MHISDARIDEVRDALRSNAADVAEHLLGQPNGRLSSSNELRFGNRGSLAVKIRGPKQGAWYDHEQKVGGDIIELIRRNRQCEFLEAVIFAAGLLGISLDGATVPPPPPENGPIAESRSKTKIEDPDRPKRIQAARAIWNASQPIEGTPAERYLVEVRRIPMPSYGWPGSALRFHARNNSLVVAATVIDGTVQAIQEVRLGADARKVNDGTPPKRALGPQDGALLRLPGPVDGPLLVAEGPETGITAWVAGGYETWVSLGQMSRVGLPSGRRIIVCADDDPRHPKDGKPANAHRQLLQATARWREEGRDVTLLYPWPTRREDKSDLNDVVQREGIAAVRARIDLALNPTATTPLRLPLAEAREKLNTAVGEFFGHALDIALSKSSPPKPAELSEPQNYAQRDWGGNYVEVPPSAPLPPPAVAIRVDVGVGKSEAARRHVVDFAKKLKQEGIKKVVVIAVPTHNLGEEQAAKIGPLAKAAGLSVEVWRGRRAPDPGDPDYGDPDVEKGDKTTMCRDLEAVSAAEEIMADVQSSVCKRKMSKTDKNNNDQEYYYCPYFYECAYQKQLSMDADIWIVPHSLIFTAKTKNIGCVAALVIDEGFHKAGLKEELRFPLDLLNTRQPAKKPEDTERLLFLEKRAEEVLRRFGDNGSLERHWFSLSGLTDDSAREAMTIEWQRKQEETELRPGMSQAERRAVVEAEKENRHVAQRVEFWRALTDLLRQDGPAASGWLSLGRGKNGERQIVLNGRREIPVGWQVPTLLLDATMRLETVRPFFPNVVMAADIAVEAPHQRVVQVYDRAYTKSALVAPESDRSLEAERRRRNLREVRDRITLEARRVSPGRVLVVAQKDVESALLACGPLPDGVETAHHNDVAGRDGWRDVALLIVIGRTMPSVAEVTRMAGALTGVKAGHCGDWYQRSDATRIVAGRVELTDADRHPDLVAEAVRWTACEGQILQIIGRGRGVMRSSENPLEVLVLTDVPLPIPIETTLPAATLHVGPAERMLLESGVVLENAEHAFKCYPGLWTGKAAARKSLQRQRSGTFPYNVSIWGCPTPLRSIRYQLEGVGQKDTRAWVDVQILPEPREWLSARLGPLASFELLPDFETEAKLGNPPLPSGQMPSPDCPDQPRDASETFPARQLQPAESSHPQVGDAAPPAPASGPSIVLEPTLSSAGDDLSQPWPPTGNVVITLSDAPPWPEDLVSTPPVLPPRPPRRVDIQDIDAARSRLNAVTQRLLAARPPSLWHDGLDLLREDWWRQRMAALRAARQPKDDDDEAQVSTS